jgi:hypothetical protein
LPRNRRDSDIPWWPKAARRGFGEIADWFETLAKAEVRQCFQKALIRCSQAPDARTMAAGSNGGSREGSLEAPTRHPLNWRDPAFYDATALEKELERVFDICHGCRRCFSLCQSFHVARRLKTKSWMRSTSVYHRSWIINLGDMCYMTKCPYVTASVNPISRIDAARWSRRKRRDQRAIGC